MKEELPKKYYEKLELNEFKLKEIDKNKLYEFLREMEFNRLLSSVISAYGEPKLENSISEKKKCN